MEEEGTRVNVGVCTVANIPWQHHLAETGRHHCALYRAGYHTEHSQQTYPGSTIWQKQVGTTALFTGPGTILNKMQISLHADARVL